MKIKNGVYVITNKRNNKKYVGISSDIENEWFNIKRDIRIGLGIKSMKADFFEFGEEVFEFEVKLLSNDFRKLHRLESELAYEYDVWNNGYNTNSLLNYRTLTDEELASYKLRFFKIMNQARDGKYMFSDLIQLLDISKNDLEILLREVTEEEMTFFRKKVFLRNTTAGLANYYVDIKTF